MTAPQPPPRPPAEQPHPITGQLFSSPVPPGRGWPGDRADASTPVARSARAVARLASRETSLADVDAVVSVCRACPRLVRWREDVARDKRKAYAEEPYWGRPVTGWGSDDAQVVIVGLAPAAHGGNRTGRIFTGDRSGDWLYAALHRAGLAALPTSVHAADGQRLIRTRMLAAVRCAPPDNKPTPAERDSCAPWLYAEMALLTPSVRAVVALGSFAWASTWRCLVALGFTVPRPRPGFGHGVRADARGADGRRVVVLGSYHPSQQNTFTGKLTEPMLDAVLRAAASA